jgi:hypothetical protein
LALVELHIGRTVFKKEITGGSMIPTYVKEKEIFFTHSKFDGFVKSPFGPIFVIPAKAGIHPAEGGTAFAGVTAFLIFYEIIKFYS